MFDSSLSKRHIFIPARYVLAARCASRGYQQAQATHGKQGPVTGSALLDFFQRIQGEDPMYSAGALFGWLYTLTIENYRRAFPNRDAFPIGLGVTLGGPLTFEHPAFELGYYSGQSDSAFENECHDDEELACFLRRELSRETILLLRCHGVNGVAHPIKLSDGSDSFTYASYDLENAMGYVCGFLLLQIVTFCVVKQMDTTTLTDLGEKAR